MTTSRNRSRTPAAPASLPVNTPAVSQPKQPSAKPAVGVELDADALKQVGGGNSIPTPSWR